MRTTLLASVWVLPLLSCGERTVDYEPWIEVESYGQGYSELKQVVWVLPAQSSTDAGVDTDVLLASFESFAQVFQSELVGQARFALIRPNGHWLRFVGDPAWVDVVDGWSSTISDRLADAAMESGGGRSNEQLSAAGHAFLPSNGAEWPASNAAVVVASRAAERFRSTDDLVDAIGGVRGTVSVLHQEACGGVGGAAYEQALEFSGGIAVDGCSDADGLTELGMLAAGRWSTFFTLEKIAGELAVEVDGVPLDAGWSEGPCRVVFDFDHIPASGSSVTIRYHAPHDDPWCTNNMFAPP
ncbi:MAG: hypothetical protein KC621_33360 [Myxococcales bacterium]|nr:hypothetical protein [Myxococcales bacterium]